MRNIVWENQYLGAPTSTETANQIQQIMQLVPSGMQNVEIGALRPEIFEAIPKEHFNQMKQIAKLTIRDFEKEGKPSPLSMHAPLIEPSGFRENKWEYETWKTNQAHLKNVVEKATDLGTSTPVNIHGSHTPSYITRYDKEKSKEYLQKIYKQADYAEEGREKYLENHKKEIELLKQNEYPDIMFVVDPSTGQLQQARIEEVHYPGKTILETPVDRLKTMNHTVWENKRREIVATHTEMDRVGQRIKGETGKAPDEFRTREEQLKYYEDHPGAGQFLRNYFVLEKHLNSQVNDALDKAIKTAELTENEKLFRGLKEVQKAGRIDTFNLITYPGFEPDVFVPVETFARGKASDTFAELALKGIDVVREKNKKLPREKQMPLNQAPVICVENVSPETAFGRGESMRDVIEESREKFVQKATERGISSSEAARLAEKLIGATWDVGHINLLKRYGYDDKKLMKELEKVKKDIKHVHITDNFGQWDAHLAPGMGNVPIKEILKELKPRMGEVRAIVEAGGYYQHFKQSPAPHVLRELNPPLYTVPGLPGWKEIGENYFFGSAGYVPGYGHFLPAEHFSMYGTGFSQLPTALGGTRAGEEKGKFAGTPMA